MRIRDRAADALADFAPSGLDRVFFVNSGAEANENALKIAKLFTGKSRIIKIWPIIRQVLLYKNFNVLL